MSFLSRYAFIFMIGILPVISPLGHPRYVQAQYEHHFSLNRYQETILWLKRNLSGGTMTNAAIFLPRYSILQAFEVYLGQTLLYRFGVIESSVVNPHNYILWHLIPLPPHS